MIDVIDNPISNSECVIIEDQKQLTDKIKSKMDVAKFFAGFISLLLGIALNDIGNLMANPSNPGYFSAFLGVILLLFSLSMSIATLFAYDMLLMPRKYWCDQSNDGSYGTDLRNDMLKAWKYFFIPSVLAFFGGLIGLLVAMTNISKWGVIVLLMVCLPPFFTNRLLPLKRKILGPKDNKSLNNFLN